MTREAVGLEGLDERAREVVMALAADGDDEASSRAVSLRSVGGDADAAHGSHHQDADAADQRVQAEDTTVSSDAKWAPVPTRRARQFIKNHPEAALDVVFPTVYEEDRSAKLKDLGTAQALGAISHRRMAEGMAKELGIDPYNYVEEMDQIRNESPPINPATQPGAGDALAATLSGPSPAADERPPTAAPEWGSPEALDREFATEVPGHRNDLGAPAQAAFRRSQRQAEEAAVATVLHDLREVRDGVERKLAWARERQLTDLTESFTASLRAITEQIARLAEAAARPAEAPPVNVHVENKLVDPKPRVVREVERDDKGLITRVVENPDETVGRPEA